jgi:hypothetical protein
LAHAIEDGFHSMLELPKRNQHEVDAVALLRDWDEIEINFLKNSDFRAK